ncbi:MAG TPA: hypothetical protein VMB51_12730 [Solirubrobacteraceae bacterium]|nr:hypothetical protein [Solirubrobacteraceae bacterium]
MFGKAKWRRSIAADQRQLLDATLALSHTQILAQVADEASIDSHTIGLLAFNGAL